jgi:hypothetical protein
VIKKACGFLHVAFEETMLDPNFHIDYRQFSKHDNAGISSSAYRKWQNEKKSAFFSESVYAWKNDKDVNFDHTSKSINQTLERFGYEVT